MSGQEIGAIAGAVVAVIGAVFSGIKQLQAGRSAAAAKAHADRAQAAANGSPQPGGHA